MRNVFIGDGQQVISYRKEGEKLIRILLYNT